MDTVPEMAGQIALFQGLPAEDVGRVMALAEEMTAEQGETVLREGEPGAALYLIEEGSVMVCKRRGEGEEILALLDAGECFGEMALIERSPRSASVVALEPCRFLVVRGEGLALLLEQDAAFAARLYRHFALVLSARLRRTGERIGDLAGEGSRLHAEMERMVQDMVTVISHEFRTPMTVIEQAAEVLESMPLTSEKRKQVFSIIRRHTQQLAHLFDDICQLAFAQGRDPLVRKHPEDFRLLVKEVFRELKGGAEERGVSLRLEMPKDFPRVPLHRAKFKRALFHLVENAIKFNREGGDAVVEVRLDGEGGSCAAIAVVDGGPGFPEEGREELFRCFVQGKGPLDPERVPGAGLGLPLARSVAAAHGGRMEIEARPQGGSRVIVFLPMNSVTRDS